MKTLTPRDRYDLAREKQEGSMWFSQKSLDDGLDWRDHIAEHFYLAGDKDREVIEAEKREAAAKGFSEELVATLYTEQGGKWQAATLAAEARHQEALRVKDDEIGRLNDHIKAIRGEQGYIIERAMRDRRQVIALESRIEKLRQCLGRFDSNVAERHEATEALATDDKAKEMSE